MLKLIQFIGKAVSWLFAAWVLVAWNTSVGPAVMGCAWYSTPGHSYCSITKGE